MFLTITPRLCHPSLLIARRPLRPDAYDWESHYPEAFAKAEAANEPKPLVRIADIGCGFGGLLVRLSPLFPDRLAVGACRPFRYWRPPGSESRRVLSCSGDESTPLSHSLTVRNNALGMEIRDKVSQYVKERCVALRREHPGRYENISCIRTNSMKYLPNFFDKGQLEKLFFLFPDPHFKTSNHRRRIIQQSLLAEYAYTLAVGGVMYTITDVEELGTWMAERIGAHPCFERLTKEELAADPVIPLLFTGTEEGQKVERNEGSTFLNVFRRIEGPK
jgi:tRNA (guanine-N7-)-methyltransferase